MKNITHNLLLGVLATLSFTSCSKEEISDNDVLIESVSSNERLRRTGVFQIDAFDIETSWNTGENSRRTQRYDSREIDGERWYDLNSRGYYSLRSLATDGNRTEWNENEESGLDRGKSMEYLASFNSIPENGVTIAQIHNRGNSVRRPWLRVFIDDDRRIKIRVTTNSPTSSSGRYNTFTGSRYSSGTDIVVKIEYRGGSADVTVRTASGNLILDENIRPTSSWNNVDDSFYLKAGVYTEGDDRQPRGIFKYFYFSD